MTSCLPCQIARSTPPENVEDLLRHLLSHIGEHSVVCPLVDEPLQPTLGPPEPAPPAPDVLAAVTALLSHEDIYRKPPRVAAPRLLERLATAGLTIHMEDR